MSPRTVTFDSNVWRKIVSPYAFPNDPSASCYTELNAMAKNRVFLGYIAEVIFNLEAIPRVKRRQYFGTYEAKYENKIISTSRDGTVHARFSISPNPKDHPGNSPYLVKHLNDAKSLGFTILSAPRIGMPRSPDLDKSMFGNRSSEDMARQQSLFGEALESIKYLGCGMEHAVKLGKKYAKNNETWFDAFDNVPDSEKHLAEKAIAEWADGDAVAAHISYELDFFCTLDKALAAGANSVFAEANRKALAEKHGIFFVTPEELLINLR